MSKLCRIAVLISLVAAFWRVSPGSTATDPPKATSDQLSIETVSCFHERLVRFCETRNCSVHYHGPLGNSKSSPKRDADQVSLAVQWTVKPTSRSATHGPELDHLWIELQTPSQDPRPTLANYQIGSQVVYVDVLAVSSDYRTSNPDSVLVGGKSIRQFFAEFGVYLRDAVEKERLEHERWEAVRRAEGSPF